MSKIIERITNNIYEGFKIKNKDFEQILEYALGGIIQTVVKTTLTIVAAYFLGILIPVLMIFLFYGILRAFSHGIHTKSGLSCTIWGVFIYLGGGWLISIYSMPLALSILIFAVSSLIYLKYAPCGTELNPVGEQEAIRKQNIIRSILILLAVTMVFNKNSIVHNAILFSMFAQAINILPITFKIFGQKGNIVLKQSEKGSFELDKRKHPVLSKENFYKNINEVKEVFKNKTFIECCSIVARSKIAHRCCMFAVLTISVFTIEPWWHNEKKMPDSMKKYLK